MRCQNDNFLKITYHDKNQKTNLLETLVLFAFMNYFSAISTLIMGLGQSLLSDLAPILKYGSTPSSDFLVKILGVNTSRLVWHMQFYFIHSDID
jgi:hypothetical protein